MVEPGQNQLPAAGRIYNHDILSCTHEEVSGNHLYSGRALGLTEPGDLIQIHPFLREEWDGITAHYRRIGLSHTSNVVWDVARERLADYPGLEPSVFFFGPGEHASVPLHRWYRVVDHINCKNNFVALANHLRLDIPHTQCFLGKEWIAGIRHFPYPCYLKAAVSVAGKGIFRCEDMEQLVQALSWFDESIPLQVQDEVPSNVFLNLQYEVVDKRAVPLMATEQILDGYTHKGNRYPASCQPWESVQEMADWLVEKGMQGVFAFDVAVVEQDGSRRYMPIECNPRYNGASYPSLIARKLGIDAWVALELATGQQRISEIDLDGIEFDSDLGSGIVLVNWGTVLAGKLGVLIAGEPAVQARLESALRARL